MSAMVLRGQPATVLCSAKVAAVTQAMPGMLPASATALDAGVVMGCPADSLRAVVERVLSARHQFKILDAVIALVPVAVMNHLARGQVSTDVRLHDEAMFKDVSVRSGERMISALDSHVAVRREGGSTLPSVGGGTPIVCALASIRAKRARVRLQFARRLYNGLPAVETLNGSRVALRFDRTTVGTESGLSRRGAIEHDAAVVAGAFDAESGTLTGHVEPPIRCANPRTVSAVAGLTLASNYTRLEAV